MASSGETDLTTILKSLKPKLNEGDYIFATVKADDAVIEAIPRKDILCEFKELEGVTLVVKKEVADSNSIPYSYVAAWITLEVHSSLEAVGLTALFAKALAAEAISCNVIAGFYHDHLFVGKEDAQKALEALMKLSETCGAGL
eukprot:TRINITY_DN102508_c0_g1_i1.p1 TRINITY_DN102508_c0_g1~~TRINITY_DN102508_c0_g1_i1.p1  ORF type:complete len:143 (+),score=20.87 TRINITY_DN102508_c0_g1_i1:123-551(+)